MRRREIEGALLRITVCFKKADSERERERAKSVVYVTTISFSASF